MSQYTLVVAGAVGVAGPLETSGRFSRVFSVTSTGGLKELIGKGDLGTSAAAKDTTAFIFADNTPCDTPEMPLGRIVQWLTTKGWRVLILAATPQAVDLARANPAAGIVEGPFTLNSILAALASSGLTVDPIEEGFEPLQLSASSPHPVHTPAAAVASPAVAAPTPAAGGWMTVPTEPAVDADRQAGTLERPAAQPASWGTPPQAEPAAQPASWGTPPQKAVDPQAGWGTPAAQTFSPPGGVAASNIGQLPALGGPAAALGTPVARVGSYQAEHQPNVRRRGHVIVVTSPKGGTGKSSLSLNLAAYLGLRLRAAGRSVCIVDTNFQQADTGKYLNVYSPNITHILKDPSTLSRDRILSQMVHKPELGFSALLGPAMGRDANPQWINARLYNQILPLLKEHFDYIIVDTPVAELFHDIHRDFALPNADFILVPITPNLPTLMNADRWLHEICQPVHVSGGSSVDRNKIGIVLNRAKDTVGLSFEEVQTELAQWRIVGVIPDTDEWQRANNENSLVATRNYKELNEAFSQVLHAATDEVILLEGLTTVATQPTGLFGRLFPRRRQ